ncbi:AAA family ATPase [Geothrix edaphica]|uniref:AAA+ ATPase domain-containing protein n=1 Tax=Geothrix edaphica TaxID=2927976 RepID=A0ABQ5Q0J2_9BACT|nr:AAA family ATPase [Geothrix edaphica]GLH68230.1 hypothetical protein GETHED_25940 [Geothrix edaphica]
MTELTLTVSQVWLGPKGGAVFQGKDQAGATHKVIASENVISRPPRPGEFWRVQGENRTHPKWGLQLEATLAIPMVPEGEHLRRFLARNRAFQGVGDVRAKMLWEKFGKGLIALLDAKDALSLAEVIGEEVAGTLVQAWEEARAEARVVEWLDQKGFPVRLAAKVVKLWGALAPEKIQENPYRMLAVAGWEQVDRAAQLIGFPQDAEARQIAAVETVCYLSMADKHTVIKEGELLLGVGRLLKVGRDGAEKALELAEGDQAVVRLGEGRWQALGPHVMETYLRDRLAAMVTAEHVPAGHLFWAAPSDAKVDELLAEFQAENSLKLTDEQKQAVWMALTQRVGMILGGAGTGKTTVLKAIMWGAERLQGTVHAVALAGRAAIRMTEATGRPARTIAGFLGAAERGELELGGSDLVVVDEASMVDLPLAYSLMRAIPEDARLLMVGDPYQLPPIGMGLVFGVYAEDDRVPKVELMQVHRQAKETGIPQVAGQIRMGTMPGLKSYEGPKAGISFMPCTSAEAQAQVIELVSELGGPGEVQILSPIKNGLAGIKAINAALHHLRAAGRDQWQGFAVDDPVIWLENDYDRKIWNGTLGVVQAAGPTSLSVLWDGHDKLMDMGVSDLDSLDLAYAISVHKAQGSQFRRVVAPVFRSRLLERTLVYTALTRATEQVVFIGDAGALKLAVEAPPAPFRRNHGLAHAEK